MCGYELPTNLQNFTQKRLNRSENIPKSFRGILFLKYPIEDNRKFTRTRKTNTKDVQQGSSKAGLTGATEGRDDVNRFLVSSCRGNTTAVYT